MALNITLYSEYRSIYKDYMDQNYGHMIYKDPGIFTLPSWLYTYDLYKAKIKFKGIQKISMVFSEFEERILIPPGKVLGAILVYNCQFDFEKLKSISSLRDQQLFVLRGMYEAVLRISDIYNLEKDGLTQAFHQTHNRITNDEIPDDFWDIHIF